MAYLWCASTSGGPGVLVTENSGIAVTTARRGRQQLVAALAEAMKILADQPDTLRAVQLGALARARELTWATVVRQVPRRTNGWRRPAS